ncbi:hypothetical protein SUGI_0706770 [Cryptomeria japonica]|nr:hypothetical protein SUGI_0706770 [Cryptomeria japonica]
MAFPTNEVSATTNDVDTVLYEICEVLKAQEDRYDGVGKKGVWIKVPKGQAKLVPVAIEVGFWYHHAEPSYVMLVYWIPQTPPTIPDNASHQVGIAAFVFNEEGQGEGIKEGAIREVHEETGIDAELVEVVGFRDGHNAPFGKSDMLFVCMLRSVSSNIVVQDTEISAAKWMAIEEFASQHKNQQSKLLKDMIGVCCQRQRTM